MIRSDLTHHQCPLARAMGQIGDGWMLLSLWAVLNGHSRFEDMQQRLGVARNILSDRLRRLTELGLVARTPIAEGSRRCEYVPTEKALPLLEPLKMLHSWGLENCPPALPLRMSA